MKITIYYGISQMLKNVMTLIMSIAMMIVTVFLCLFSEISFFDTNAARISIKKNLGDKYDNVYLIDADSFYWVMIDEKKFDKINQFQKWMSSQPEILCSGYYGIDEEEMEIYISGNINELLIANYSEKMPEKNDYMYCGCNAEIEDEEYYAPFEKEGKLPEDAYFIRLEFGYYDCKVDLSDYKVIVNQTVDIPTSGIRYVYCVKDNIDVEALKRKVIDKVLEYDLQMNVMASLDEMFVTWNDSYWMDKVMNVFVPFVMIIISVIAFCLCTKISFNTNRYDNGVMICNGMSRKQIKFIYLFENWIKVTCAYIIAMVLEYKIFHILDGVNLKWQMILLVLNYAFLLILGTLSCLPIMRKIDKKLPIDFIRKVS